MDVAAQSNIVEDRRSPEELNLLKGPGDPQPGPFIGFDLCDVFSLEMNLSLLRVVETIDAIEKDCFSGPLGPIIEKISPFLTSKLTSHRACTPPKAMLRLLTFSWTS